MPAPAQVVGNIIFDYLAHKRDQERIDIARTSSEEASRLARDKLRVEYGSDVPDYSGGTSVESRSARGLEGSAMNLPESAYPTKHIPGTKEREITDRETRTGIYERRVGVEEDVAGREEAATPIGEQPFTEADLGNIEGAMSNIDQEGGTSFMTLLGGMLEGARTRAKRGINKGDLYLGMKKRFSEPDIQKTILGRLSEMKKTANEAGKVRIGHLEEHAKAGTLADHFMTETSAWYKQAEKERAGKASTKLYETTEGYLPAEEAVGKKKPKKGAAVEKPGLKARRDMATSKDLADAEAKILDPANRALTAEGGVGKSPMLPSQIDFFNQYSKKGYVYVHKPGAAKEAIAWGRDKPGVPADVEKVKLPKGLKAEDVYHTATKHGMTVEEVLDQLGLRPAEEPMVDKNAS